MKRYFAKIYEPTISGVQGDFVGMIKDVDYPGHSWNINSGLGECTIRFPQKASDFDDLDLFYQVDVYVLDKESPATGVIIYSGYVIDITNNIDSDEHVSATLWGYPTEWASTVLEKAGATTVDYDSYDPSEIVKDVLDQSETRISYNLAPVIEEDFSTDNQKDSGGYWNPTNEYVEIQSGSHSQGNAIDTQNIWTIDKVAANSLTQVAQIKHDCTIDSFVFSVAKVGSPTDNLECNIYECDEDGIPTATLIVACGAIGGATLSNLRQNVTFTPVSTLTVTQGQKIAIKFTKSGPADPPDGFAIYYNYTNLTDYTSALWYEGFLTDVFPMAANYSINYTTTDDNAISLGYDTTLTTAVYSGCTPLNAGVDLTMYYSDSDDNSTWGAWTTDITTLTKRYIRWKAVTTSQALLTNLLFDVSGGSISRTGTTVSYEFKQNTIKDCIDQCITMSPSWWFWRVGADNVFVFAQRNTDTINHRFTVGKNATSIKLTRSGKNMANTYYFLGGSTVYIKDTRSGSVLAYGRRDYKSQDERVTNQDSAQIITTSYLNVNDHPSVMGEVTILDSNCNESGYDIESLKVGEVCIITDPKKESRDSKWDEAYWDEAYWDFPLTSVFNVPFQITSINYQLDRATLTLAYYQPDGIKRIQDIKRNLETSRTINSPTSPTEV